jgi:DmsE family decaheme c-type cytochrome
MKHHKGSWAFYFFSAILVILPSAVGRAQQDSGKASDQNSDVTAAAPANNSDYAGSEVCKTCHEDTYNSWEKSPHWKTTLDTKGGPSHQGCEGCHGPGAAHVDGGGDITKIFVFEKSTPKEINDRCLTCHASTPSHLNSSNSFHRLNDVSCTDCHSSHSATTKENLLIKEQPDLCYTCHLQQKAQFNMPFRHRVNEGLIKCTDCHNQHGTGGVWESDHLVRQVRTSDSGNFVCFKCHADKQGPYVFAHASVKVEGCATCHIPHGGANPHMLKYSNVNLLCLQCHTAAHFGAKPGTGFPVMDAQNSTQQQACTLCHTQVHGSNFSNLFFR